MDSASGGRSSSREGCDIALLFRAHHGELVRIAVLMVRDRPTAEDVVQDVFASLHARAAKLPSCQAAKLPSDAEALACALASVLNRCRSVLRRRAVASPLSVRPAADAGQSAEFEALPRRGSSRGARRAGCPSDRRKEVLVLRY